MRRFFRKRSVRVALVLFAVALYFWKPILAHSSHDLSRWTYPLSYAPGKDLYIACFADTELISFGGRFGIDDLRKFALDESLARQGRDRARSAVDCYDRGYFATDMVNHYRENLAEQRKREWYWRINPDYWMRALHADYVEYIAAGAPRRPDWSHLPPPTWPPPGSPPPTPRPKTVPSTIGAP